MTDNEPLAVEVYPAALLRQDVLLADPDNPDRKVRWEIGAVGREGDVIVAEYVTEDGTEGRHGFEDPHQVLTVACRSFTGVAA